MLKNKILEYLEVVGGNLTLNSVVTKNQKSAFRLSTQNPTLKS